MGILNRVSRNDSTEKEEGKKKEKQNGCTENVTVVNQVQINWVEYTNTTCW